MYLHTQCVHKFPNYVYKIDINGAIYTKIMVVLVPTFLHISKFIGFGEILSEVVLICVRCDFLSCYNFDIDAIKEQHIAMKFFFVKCGFTSMQMLEHLKCGFWDSILGKTIVFGWYKQFKSDSRFGKRQKVVSQLVCMRSKTNIYVLRNLLIADHYCALISSLSLGAPFQYIFLYWWRYL